MISPFEDLSGPSVDIQETTEDAFSSSEDYAPINRENPQEDYDYDDLESRTHFGHGRAVSTSSSTYTASNQAHPGRALSWAAERELYPGIGGHAPIAPVSDITMPDVRSYSSASGRL